MICGLRGRTRRPVLLKVRVDELDVLFPHPLDDDTTPILGFPHAEHTMWNLLFQPCLIRLVASVDVLSPARKRD